MSKQSDLVSVSQGSGGDPLYIDTTNDRVGVGTTSPVHALHVNTSSGNSTIHITNSTTGGTIADGFSLVSEVTTNNAYVIQRENADLVFRTNNTERMRIDSSGNFYLGKTSTSSAVAGIFMQPTGGIDATRSGVRVLTLNRLTSDGDIIEFQKDNAKVGSISGYSGDLVIGTGDMGLRFDDNGNALYPVNANNGVPVDNLHDLGDAFARWDDVWATNGTIQTSDINDKQDIEALSDAEQRVAVAAKGLLRKYRWKDAVAEKGDAARIHFGIIAQDLQAAFEAEGLDAARYGMFIRSTWWEAEVEKTREVEQEDGTTITETYTVTETYDEATEGATERTRLGVRYPELLAFIIAAL